MTSYDQAGVSLAAADAVVERLRAAAESTRSDAVVGGLGGFAGLYALDDERLLAASTDGVGTKLVLAREAGRLRDAGRDLAAHCMNDVATTGAEPLFFLDYVAAHRLDLEQVAELVEGAAEVCRAAGCALLGGETAEMPGVYREEELDFAGTCVGVVRRADLIDGSRVVPGDVVLGLPSSGLHANGFSLVRRLIDAGAAWDADLLLAPTRLYLEDVRAAPRGRRRARARPRDRRWDRRQSAARPPRGPRRGDRPVRLGAAGRVPLAGRARRRRGRAAPHLQPRDRDVRGRPGGRRK